MKSGVIVAAAIAASAQAEVYSVLYETDVGNVTFEIHEEWAPLGAARFKQLIQDGFYNNAAFFRYLPKLIVQWGIAADPKNNNYTAIKDDKWFVKSNTLGTIAYASAGNDTRTTQLFVNFKNNSVLDKSGFTPFGIVTSGLDILIDKVYSGYGGKPDQAKIYAEGDAYLKREFPLLTRIKKASFVKRPGC